MLRCASPFAIEAYVYVRLTPQGSRALPAAFLRSRPTFKAYATFYDSVIMEKTTPIAGCSGPQEPFYGDDPLHFFDRGNDFLKLAQVVHADHKIADRLSILRNSDFGVGDVDVEREYGGADIGEQPFFIVAEDPHVDRILPLFADVPLDVHQPVGVHFPDMRAVRRMDSNPPPAGDVACDLVPRYGIAASAEPDHDVIDSGQRHAYGLRFRAFLAVLGGGCLFRGFLIRQKMVNDLFRRHPAVTDDRHQIVQGCDMIFGKDLCHRRRFGDLSEF